MSHCPLKIAVVQTSVYFVGGDLATVRIFRLSVMTRCHKVIVDFTFIACEQALHSKGQAEQAAREHASKQLAARGRGKPILSPPPPNPLTHPPPPPNLFFSRHLSWLLSPNGKTACRSVGPLSVNFSKKE